MKNQKLTPKRKKFCDEYLKDLNATQAAIRAGYSEKTANEQGARLLAKVSIKSYIEQKQQKIAKKNEITQEYILNGLKKVYERCMQEEAMKDVNGNFEGIFKFEHAGANKALELLGKHLGLFAERIKVGGDDKSPPLNIKMTMALDEVDSRMKDILGKE